MAPIRRPMVVNGPLIKPREPGRLGDLAWMILLGAVLALPAFLYAGLQANLHQYRREIVALEERIQDLDEQRRRLDVELAALSDPRRIEQLARTVNGLVPAEQAQVVYLPWPPAALDQGPRYLAEATGDADGRQRP